MVTEDEEEGQMRHYIVKREFAEGAILMEKIKFPAAALPSSPSNAAPAVFRCRVPASFLPSYTTQPCSFGTDVPWRAFMPKSRMHHPERVRRHAVVPDCADTDAVRLLTAMGV